MVYVQMVYESIPNFFDLLVCHSELYNSEISEMDSLLPRKHDCTGFFFSFLCTLRICQVKGNGLIQKPYSGNTLSKSRVSTIRQNRANFHPFLLCSAWKVPVFFQQHVRIIKTIDDILKPYIFNHAASVVL